MRIYIDTEFTDFRFGDLISIGMVDEYGRTFYGENRDYSRKHCTDFTKKEVLWQLGKQPHCMYSRQELRDAIVRWLEPYEGEGALICIDFDGDWTLFCELLEGVMPYFVSALDIYPKIDKHAREQYFRDTGLAKHHALHDAFANKFAYRPTN